MKKAPQNAGLFLIKTVLSGYRPVPEPGPVGVKVDPLGEPLGPSVFPDGFMLVGGLLVEAEPVLPVAAPVVPLVVLPVAPPLMDAPPVVELAPPEAPPVLVCATANVLDSASAAARVIVESFMVVSLCVI
jgi:hypothetical protein